MKTRDDLNDTIEAPVRSTPGALPEIDSIKNIRRKHMALIEQLAKADEKREQAITKFRRADDKVQAIRKALARSTKRMVQAQADARKPNTMHDDPVYRRVR